MNQTITYQHVENGMSYQDYSLLIENLVLQGKTTGQDQGNHLVEYTKLNAQRMRRLDKTTLLQTDILGEIATLSRSWYWIVLTEAWCGDAAQSIPVIAKVARLTPHISLKLLLRDEHSDIMNNYLTNGSRSIPKLICLDENLQELGTWGPRPAEAQQLVLAYKANPQGSYQDFTTTLQGWYAKNKTLAIQQEILALIRQWRSQAAA